MVAQALEAVGELSEKPTKEGLTVGILLTDNKKMRTLNAKFRSKDSATDVIAFPTNTTPLVGEPQQFGDIAISLDLLLADAVKAGKSPAEHFSHLFIHGLLHLKGYEHDDEEKSQEMRTRETQAMIALGYDNPYA